MPDQWGWQHFQDVQHLNAVLRQQQRVYFVTPNTKDISLGRSTWRDMVKGADALIAQEVRATLAVQRWCARRLGGRDIAEGHVVGFVKAVYERHEKEIKHWGSWHFVGEPREMQDEELTAIKVRDVLAAAKDSKAGKAFWRVLKEAGCAVSMDYFGRTAVYEHQQLLCNKLVPYQMTRKIHVSKDKRIEACLGIFRRINITAVEPEASLTARALHSYMAGIISAPHRSFASFRPGEKISAAMISAANKAFPFEFEEYIKFVEEIVRRCGEEVWTLQALPITAVLSVAPSSFLMIGNYGYDRDSCFRTNGGGHSSHKRKLASSLDGSFSMMFYRDAKDKKEKLPKNRYGIPAGRYNVARGWGFVLNGQCAVASNFYGLLQRTLRPIYGPLIEEAFNFKIEREIAGSSDAGETQWYHNLTDALMPVIYFNNDAHFLLMPGGSTGEFGSQLRKQLNATNKPLLEDDA